MGYWLAGSILLFLAVMAALSRRSRKMPAVGQPVGRLRPCPESPNCVCSEETHARALVPPLVFDVAPSLAWQAAAAAVQAAGGEVVRQDPGYLHATFTTTLFRFKDDLELRMDEGRGVIHVRSASRVGYSDFGQNRRRARRLRRLFDQQLHAGRGGASGSRTG